MEFEKKLIDLSSGLPFEVRDLCTYLYKLTKILKEPKVDDVGYLIEVASLMRFVNSRILFILGEAWKRSGEEEEPKEIKEFKKDIKSLQTILKERPGLIMLYKVGMIASQIFDVLVSTKYKVTKLIPDDWKIRLVNRIIVFRYLLFEELLKSYIKLKTHPFISVEDDLKKKVEDVYSKYIAPYFPDLIQSFEIKKPKVIQARDYFNLKKFLVQIEKQNFFVLIKAIENTGWLEEKFGSELVKKIFFMDFEEERNEFYKVFREQIALRVGTIPAIEVEGEEK